MTDISSRIDVLLSILNATELGSLDAVVAKFEQVRGELQALEALDLAAKADEAVQALRRGDLDEWRRLRAYLQSKVGHLRP